MDHEFYGPAYEAPEDDFCDCEEDKMCEPCRSRRTRHAIQAGLHAAFVALPVLPIAAASVVEDELLIDAAIADALMERPSIPWVPSRATAPRKAAGIASIGNGIYVRSGRRA